MSRVERIGDATLYMGDWRDVALSKSDLVVTDPPYGIGFDYDSHIDCPRSYADLLSSLEEYPRAVLQYPEEMMRHLVPLWGAPDDVYAWCYESNLPRQFRLWAWWLLRPDWSKVRQPAKWAHLAKVKDPTRSSMDWCTDLAQVKNTSPEKTAHPCQVPTALVERVIAFSGSWPVVQDPFMGSGTTGVACANLGRKFIGIEIDPGYFDIACRRIEEAYKQPPLFDEPAAPRAQPSMFDGDAA